MKIDKSGWKWIKRGWKWMKVGEKDEVDENGWKWMKMDASGWKWVKMDEVDENEWKWMKSDESKWKCMITLWPLVVFADYLMSTWWLLGDHLVTTWWPFDVYLLTIWWPLCDDLVTTSSVFPPFFISSSRWSFGDSFGTFVQFCFFLHQLAFVQYSASSCFLS